MESLLSPRSTLLRLYLEEVRALPRGRFALWSAGALFAVLGVLAAGPATAVVGGLWGFGFVAYVLVPSALAAIVAGKLAGARASHFVHGVFTTPVTRRQYMLANVLAYVTLGTLYLVATLPFVAVAVYHLTESIVVPRFFAVGVAMVAFATALGTLLGVCFARRGTVFAGALAAILALAAMMGVLYFAALATGDGALGNALRAAHVSPVVLGLGVAGLLPFGQTPTAPGRSAIAFGLLTVGLFVLASWIYLREQGVEDWHTSSRRKVLLALIGAAVVLAPAAVAGSEYMPGGIRIDGSLSSSMENMFAALSNPGADAHSALFGDRAPPLRVGEANPRELILVLPAARTSQISDVHVALSTDSRLLVDGVREWSFDSLPDAEVIEFSAQGGAYPQEAYALPVIRVPLQLVPSSPESFSRNAYEVTLDVAYVTESTASERPDGEARNTKQQASATFSVVAYVPNASTHMALAGAPSIVACVGGAFLRRKHTR